MNWNDIKERIGLRCPMIETDEDTIEFDFMERSFKLHRFEIPDGFLVNKEIKNFYNGRLVLYEKIDEEWRLFNGYRSNY